MSIHVNLRAALCALAAVALPPLLACLPLSAAAGAPPAVEVTRQGFCLRRLELRCLEVALPAGAPIELGRLPELPDGQHGIWFYSDQVAAPKAVYVQVLEALDDDAQVDYREGDPVPENPPELGRRLKTLATRLAAGGREILTAFRGRGGAEPVRSFSSLPIDGPGEFAAHVVDLDGTPVPGSQRLTISVMISAGSRPSN